MRRLALLLSILVVLALASCTSAPRSATLGCDRADDSVAEALEAADIVYTARVIARLANQDLDGETVHVYSISNIGLPSFKGEDVGYENLSVISHPGCAEETYADGDPLADAVNGGEVVLFMLRTNSGGWITLPTPNGVVQPSKVPA